MERARGDSFHAKTSHCMPGEVAIKRPQVRVAEAVEEENSSDCFGCERPQRMKDLYNKNQERRGEKAHRKLSRTPTKRPTPLPLINGFPS